MKIMLIAALTIVYNGRKKHGDASFGVGESPEFYQHIGSL